MLTSTRRSGAARPSRTSSSRGRRERPADLRYAPRRHHAAAALRDARTPRARRPPIYGEPGWHPTPPPARRPATGKHTRTTSAPSRIRETGARLAGSPGVVAGLGAVFGQWTTIHDPHGPFLERIAPGAFASAVRDPSQVRVLFQHGRDPLLGSRPLGTLDTLRETAEGLYYEASLFPGTIASAELVPLLKAGVLGSSFRFAIDDQTFARHPPRSSFNPDGIPERIVRAAELYELGPVVFPAYAGATSGLLNGG